MNKLSLILLVLFSGCSSVSRQVFKARQIFDKYPNEAAKYCGDKFPVADSVISVMIDSSKGKIMDYMPALDSLQQMLDSAKAILNNKQTALTDLNGQLAFTKTQLTAANKLVDNLTLKITLLKADYKPCSVDTIKENYTEIRTNTAKLMALTAQTVTDGKIKENLQNSLQNVKTQSAHRLYFLISVILLIAIYIAFKVYKFFAGGGVITSILR